MPAGEYKLKLLIDDSKIRELEKRLGNAVGGSQKSGLDSVFGSAGSAGKNLAKLGIIAGGMATAVITLDKIWRIGIESSGHAQATFKIWDTAMRLIFRPIGDTVGIVLRPFGLLMLKWAVPFYRKFTQNFDKLFTAGEKAAKGDVIRASADAGGVLAETFFGEEAGKNWEDNQNGFADFIDTVNEFFSTFLQVPEAFGDVSEEANNASVSLGGLKNELSIFDEFGEKLGGISTAFGGLGNELGFFGGIVQAVQDRINKVMNAHGTVSNTGQGGARSARNAQSRGFGSGSSGSTSSNLISREEFLNLRQQLGNRGALEYMRSSGFSVGNRSVSSNTSSSNGRGRFGESSNVTINVNGAVDESTLRKIGKVASDEISKRFKQMPGRRG